MASPSRLLSGIYNANPDELSLLATFPNFRKLEQEHGSVTRGVRAASTANGRIAVFRVARRHRADPGDAGPTTRYDRAHGLPRRTASHVPSKTGYRVSLKNGDTLRAQDGRAGNAHLQRARVARPGGARRRLAGSTV